MFSSFYASILFQMKHSQSESPKKIACYVSIVRCNSPIGNKCYFKEKHNSMYRNWKVKCIKIAWKRNIAKLLLIWLFAIKLAARLLIIRWKINWFFTDKLRGFQQWYPFTFIVNAKTLNTLSEHHSIDQNRYIWICERNEQNLYRLLNIKRHTLNNCFDLVVKGECSLDRTVNHTMFAFWRFFFSRFVCVVLMVRSRALTLDALKTLNDWNLFVEANEPNDSQCKT